MLVVDPDYISSEFVRDVCEPWIKIWSGDEWGESMESLHSAAKTCYGFTDEDCALFATRLLANLIDQREWVIEDGINYGFAQPVDIFYAQNRASGARDYWSRGGNLGRGAPNLLDSLPPWFYGGDLAA